MNTKIELPNLKTNIFGLFVLHGLGFILTLASIPYLTSIFGASGWGKIVFIQLILNYACWVTNWGFYLGGTKTIASLRGDPKKINEFFSKGIFGQLILTIFSILTLLFLILIFDGLRKDLMLYLSGVMVIFGNFLMPLWFLNGLERIIEASIIQNLVKFISLIFYFLLIKEQDQLHYFFLINGLAMTVIGLFTLLWIKYFLKYKLIIVKFNSAIKVVKENLSLFLGTMIANINATIIPFSIGMISGDQALGYFNIADRMRTAAVQVLHPITHALFPRMGYLISNRPNEAKKLAIKSSIILGSFSIILSILIFVFAKEIILFIAGAEFEKSITILKIISISPFLTTMYAFLVYQILIPSGYNKQYLFSVSFMSIMALLSITPLISYYGLIGASIAVIGIELIGLIFLLYLTFYKYKVFTNH